ncbi:MAG: NlpC/P60 family protein [Actinobacteria bacterium]|nr:NlpC/P60 family protein [Actinomycetota bacterium]
MDNKTKYLVIALAVTLVVGIAVVPLIVIMATASLMVPSTIDRCQATSLDPNGVGIGGAGYTVMSYNIKHAKASAKSAGMSAHTRDYKWSNRGPVVAQYIANVNPDLLGLQEVSKVPGSASRQLEVIESANPGYTWVYSTTADPIGWRASAFALLDKGQIRLNYKGRDGATLNRFANWVKLRATSDGSTLFFVNLHAQFAQLKAQAKARSVGWTRLVKGLAKQNPGNGDPSIIVGDFNALNNEIRAVFRDHLVKLGAAGFVQSTDTATTIAPISRVNSYNGWGDTIGGKFYYKAINRSSAGNHIDYVWTGGEASATTWQIYTGPTATWKTINGSQVPFTAAVASDHWPVIAHVVVGSSASTLSYTQPSTATTGSVAGWNSAQMQIAAQIIAAGKSMGLDTWTLTVGVMTGMGESSLRNLDYGDAAGPDSRGVFQQRSGWGPLADRMDPYKASQLFFRALIKVPGYHSLAPTIAAHRTQRNADPYHYAKYWDDAVKVVAAITSDSSALALIGAAGDQACAGQSYTGGTGAWADVIQFALSLVGRYPYSWGGGGLNGPTEGFGEGAGIIGFDCSSFVRYVVYQKSGAILPRTSRDQAKFLQARGFVTRTNSYSQLQAGDILFFSHGDSAGSIYHVALVVGPGEIVEEPGLGRYVQHNKIANRMPADIWGYARFDLAALAGSAA